MSPNWTMGIRPTVNPQRRWRWGCARRTISRNRLSLCASFVVLHIIIIIIVLVEREADPRKGWFRFYHRPPMTSVTYTTRARYILCKIKYNTSIVCWTVELMYLQYDDCRRENTKTQRTQKRNRPEANNIILLSLIDKSRSDFRFHIALYYILRIVHIYTLCYPLRPLYARAYLYVYYCSRSSSSLDLKPSVSPSRRVIIILRRLFEYTLSLLLWFSLIKLSLRRRGLIT